jgi:ligand-binding sensor domain-containing protein/serine phosphatase RsbU (regulator of sigma subunit)
MFKYILLICSIIIANQGNGFAQNFNIVKLGVREGLLHSLVTGITQDKRGDIWMSTGGGLCRYNGVDFEYITTRNGLKSTRLTCVATDEDDNIWVGSSKGLNLIIGKSIHSIPDSLIGSEVLAISSAGSLSVWVATVDGLYKVCNTNGVFSSTKVYAPTQYSTESSQIFQDRTLSSFIYHSKSNKVFYGNNGNLYNIYPERIEKINIDPSIQINAITEISDSIILLGTNRGINKYENNNIAPYSNLKTSNIDIKSLTFDNEKIWFLGKNAETGSNETLLFSIDVKAPYFLRKIGKSNGLADEPTQMYIDHEGNVWTTSNNGVSILKGNAFVAYTTANGLIGNKIWGVHRTNDSSLWVGTIGEGLTVLKGTEILHYSIKNGLPDNYVGKIYQAKNGSIYVGTSNAGLCKAQYNNKNKSYSFLRLPLLEGTKLRIDDLIEDELGNIWVATSKGLYASSNGQQFTHKPIFQMDTGQVFVQKLLIDPLRKVMWIGTRYLGLYYMQGNVILRFNAFDPKEEVSSLTLDSQGDLWIGTRNNGVLRYDGVALTRLTEKDGLASNLIYLLHADDQNNLWIGSNLGIDKFDIIAFKNENRVSIRHYGSDEGLVDLETNLNGVFSDQNSVFWVATNGGLLKYERSADKPNSVPPIVRITSLKLNSQTTDWQSYSTGIDPWNGLPSELSMRHNQNHFTFEFIGISFRNPKQVNYAWKLDGFDTKWIESRSRQAIYSNLPPGNYVFRVKAANSDSVWSNEVQSMPFTIRPPFWATWWFRISMVIIVAILIYFYVINRIRSLRKKQRELENLVNVRTIELREQFEIVDVKNKQILDSLKYAKFLQDAILVSIDNIKSNFADAFIFNRPKDYVSGDFFWHTRSNDISVFAVADCTGHGIPGAIISVICENALRLSVTNCEFKNPAEILVQTNKYVIDTFAKTHKEIHHGMEVALCIFNHSTGELTFSGASLGMNLITNNQPIDLKPSIHRIGWDLSIPKYFNVSKHLSKGDTIYLFTDGFGDQFEPKNKKKYSKARLKKLLFDNTKVASDEMIALLSNEFDAWKANYDQIDDVLVVGIKI